MCVRFLFVGNDKGEWTEISCITNENGKLIFKNTMPLNDKFPCFEWMRGIQKGGILCNQVFIDNML